MSFYIFETQYEPEKGAVGMKYWYEMVQRPVNLGCQPKGFVDTDPDKGRWGLVAYDRELTEKELGDYTIRKWEGAE